MAQTLKIWTRLGLGAAFAGVALAGCGDGGEAGEAAQSDSDITVSSVAGDTGEGELGALGEGEGGEGEGEAGEGAGGEGEGGEGEGGVSIAAAASDPVVYSTAIAIAEAHVLAARDAYALGETAAAAELFAHPVSEVLADMAPIFDAQGVASFTGLFADASLAALEGATPEDISARVDEITATLRDAETKRPLAEDVSDIDIYAGVAADLFERASDMYRAAAEVDRYEPYLDGYGFYKAGEAAFERAESASGPAEARVILALSATRDALSAAYPTAEKPDALDANTGAIAAAVAAAQLELSGD
ncbi:MAG: hypothetical protein AAFQ84_11805 [Pseudomonadota bacterium]